MKMLFICAALLIPLAVRAASSEDQLSCLMEGQAFKVAAQYRDDGTSPTDALSGIAGYSKIQHGKVPLPALKNAVNLVFFDSRFAGAGGDALAQQVTEACMYPNGRYQPLK